jgi:uncharacterized protein involved in exopolysaccharide biosynthesis
MQDEIDLRPYVVALARHGRIIALIVIMATIGAMLVAVSLPQNYTASADILILPSQSQVTFDSRFVTDNTVLGTDIPSRRQSLIALASSQALEGQVRSQLPPDLAQTAPGALARRMDVRAEGDLLHIETSASDPQLAQTLATSWGQAYATTVNDLYSGSDHLLKEVETQLAEAQQRYAATQQELETFVGSSTIVQVTQQISITSGLLAESGTSVQLLYGQYLAQVRSLDATLHDAETLRQQVAAGQTQGLATSLAALALRARAVGNVQLPIDLRFDDPGTLAQENNVTAADLGALIDVLRQRRTELLGQSQQFAQAVDAGDDSEGGLSLALRHTYVKRLNELNQQYEQQTAQLKLLQQRRNQALDSLSILQRKLDEQRVVLGAPEVQVRFISTVIAPPRSVLSRLALYGGAAAFAALFLSVLVVLGHAIVQPWVAQRRAPARSERPLDRPTPS